MSGFFGGGGGGGGGGTVTNVSAGDASVTVANPTTTPTIETADIATIAGLHATSGNWSNNSHKITSLAPASASTDAASLANTLDQFGAPAANVPFNAKKITGLANGSAASDAAAFGQIPVAPASATTPVWPITVLSLAQSLATIGPGANVATFTPFIVPFAMTIDRLLVNIGVSSGNLDVGIYANDGTGGTPKTRLVSLGSSASPGTGQRSFTIGSTLLQAGVYYTGFAADNGVITITYVNGVWQTNGLNRYDIAASFPLPSTVTAGAGSGNNMFLVIPIGI